MHPILLLTYGRVVVQTCVAADCDKMVQYLVENKFEGDECDMQPNYGPTTLKGQGLETLLRNAENEGYEVHGEDHLVSYRRAMQGKQSRDKKLLCVVCVEKDGEKSYLYGTQAELLQKRHPPQKLELEDLVRQFYK